MVIVGTRPVRTPKLSFANQELAERLPACFVCRKNSNQVKLVITDPANQSSICERCADESVRVFVCTCVC